MMVYRMTFDIAVSNYCSHDVYTLQSLIAKAICSGKDVLAAEGKKENCLISKAPLPSENKVELLDRATKKEGCK